MRQYSNTAVETELTGSASNVDATISVADTTGFPVTFPYTLSIDADNASKELVEVTAAAGTTLTVTRGIDGTSAVSHSLGAAVRHDHSARDFREPQEHIVATSDVHGVTGALVGTDTSQTLTNKTINLGANTLTGGLAQFNSAASGFDFASLDGAETLTNKTIDLTDNTLSGTKAEFNASLSDGDFASQAGAETLTNKTFDSTSPTAFLPPGLGPLPFSGSSVPTGWLLCDGTAVSRGTYAGLFSAIGTTYGSGDGSTTFNLPNLKGRVPVGRDAAQTEFDTLGETGGAKTHTLTEAELPAHDHSIDHDHASTSTSAAGNHDHDLNMWYHDSPDTHDHSGGTGHGYPSNAADQAGTLANALVTAIEDAGNHAHTVDLPAYTGDSGTAGSGAAHNNLQPYLVTNYIIKT